ncbi:MAG: AbrB family transcriptional regulator [Rhizobiaceae bacterium]|nr:AbrB family transcriptional regulator [Rhizobiaceae bacterium]
MQWLLLALVSAPITAIFYILHLPAALLFGPMLVAIVAGLNHASIRVARIPFAGAQGIIGCLVAQSISPAIYKVILADWPTIAVAVLATLAASSFLGWFISYLKVLPGSTAVWGSAPGGATAMVVMASAFGADARLVAFMQYLRVIFVTAAAVVISGLVIGTESSASAAETWFPPIIWPSFGLMIAAVALGGITGFVLRLPSPFFLGSIILGLCLHLGAGVDLQIPLWLRSAAYVVIGWKIGLSFTRAALRQALHAMPQIIASILALMLFCGGMAWFVSRNLGVDLLTAYLATSPGGLDSVAIIALASDRVDLSFILALQTARLLAVLILGPPLAKLIVRQVKE